MRRRLAAATLLGLVVLTGCGKDDVDPNPGQGNDVCQGEECGDEDKDD